MDSAQNPSGASRARPQAQAPAPPARPVPARPVHFNSGSVRPTALVAREQLRQATDPMRRIWDALETGGYKPQGPLHKFRSRCPGHDSDSPSLMVGEGADKRVLLYCNVGCEPRAILDALGLRWADCFPPGHRHAAAQKPRPVRSLGPGAAFIDTVTLAGYRWMAPLLLDECPYCAAPHCVLRVHDAGGLDVDCSDGCIAEDVRRAVETRAAIAEKGLDL